MCKNGCFVAVIFYPTDHHGSGSLIGALSPMLPVSLVMGQSASATRLGNGTGEYQIKCLQPGRSLGRLGHFRHLGHLGWADVQNTPCCRSFFQLLEIVILV